MKTERRETISPGGRLLLRRVNNQQICAAFRFRVEADFRFLSLAVRTDRAAVHKPFSGGTHPEHAECESSGRTFKRRAETDVRIRGKIEFRTPQLKVFPIRILQDEPSVFHGETFIFKLRIDLRTHQSPDAESGGTEFEIAVDNGIGLSRREYAASGKQEQVEKNLHSEKLLSFHCWTRKNNPQTIPVCSGMSANRYDRRQKQNWHNPHGGIRYNTPEYSSRLLL